MIREIPEVWSNPALQSVIITLFMDNFNTLSSRLLNRCPNAGISLCQQFVNDAWHSMQARREWSFRRRSGTFAPPTLYNAGAASSNVSSGNPNLITGFNTSWTFSMVGTQIRIGGLLYPFYTIVAVLSPTSLLIDQPWAGPDVSQLSYTIQQVFYPVPADFGYWYTVVSIKDSYRLWTNVTESDLNILDPQRTNFGQTYAVSFKDYTGAYGGTVGQVVPISSLVDPAPISTTTNGYSYPSNATFIIQVVAGGISGTATFQWMVAGQTAWTGPVNTSDQAVDLSNGVQVYWPDGVNYVAGDLFIINCISQITQAVPRYELWPGPTFSGYLYPYIYIAKESDISVQSPNLPPFIANRGEVLLEMALEKCAEFPGQDADHPNIYHDLRQAKYHQAKYLDMLVDLERNDEEVGVTNIDYQMFPMYPAPWFTGAWQQTHSPFLEGF